MKTLSKKLISLMLVALMLVAAMPMAAFADEEVSDDAAYQELVTNINATVTVTVNGDTYTGRYTVKSDFDFDSASDTTKKNILKATGLPNYTQYDIDDISLDNGVLTVSVTVKENHKHIIEVEDDPEDNDNHLRKCSLCGESTVEPHTYKVTSKGDENGHNVKCTVCGHTAVIGHEDSGEKVTVTARKEPTCTKAGAEEKTTYACGYSEGGETIEALGHDYDANGKCTRCGALDDENTTTYTVTIVYTKGGNVVENATVELTLKDIENLKKSNASNAKQILGRTSGASTDDDKIIDNYYGSINSCFSYMAIVGNEIEIGVTKNLSSSATADSEKITVTVVDGGLTDSRELTVGKSYFNYDLTLGNNNNKSLASVRISYEVNGKTYTRTAKKGDSDAKVQAYDTQVELLWDAKQVTINFYRNAADGAEKVSTMTIRAGETIEGLPKLDGEYVSWYLESGELLQEGRTYDFVSTTVRAYPYAGGEVYLQIYKNGDTKTPVNNNPTNVTAKVQKNGIISASDLTKTIENAVGKKNLKITGLFDFDGWENYKSTKSTRDASSTIDVGTADERTGVQFLYVMVNGGTSSSADPSNPKTGDNAMIGTAAAVMAAAVLGLGATAVVLKKKEQF